MSLYSLYSITTALAAPALFFSERRRARERGIAPERLSERFGHASQPRPAGPLIWLNAVSVGEAKAAATLMQSLAAQNQPPNLLLTTTTATAAQVVAPLLPKGAIHQYLPLDTPAPVRRFLDHWMPDVVGFVESDIWPRLVVESHKRGARLALINTRLSDKTLRRWAKVAGLVTHVLSRMSLVTTARADMADAIAPYLTCPVTLTADLKSAPAAPQEVDSTEFGPRKVWLAASTHEGEEALALSAHRQLRQTHPEALLILAPRHPERFDEAAQAVKGSGLRVARRSEGAQVGPEHAVYLADTLGEMAQWYHAAPVTFLGGSTKDHGGHNPFEPAQAGSYVVSGPDVTNAKAAFEGLCSAQGAEILDDPSTLGPRVATLLAAPELDTFRAAAKAHAQAQENGAAQIAPLLLALMGRDHG